MTNSTASKPTLEIITNGTDWAIAKIYEGCTHPQVFGTYKTKRRAVNAFKRMQNMGAEWYMDYYAGSALGSVLGSYFSGQFEVVTITI